MKYGTIFRVSLAKTAQTRGVFSHLFPCLGSFYPWSLMIIQKLEFDRLQKDIFHQFTVILNNLLAWRFLALFMPIVRVWKLKEKYHVKNSFKNWNSHESKSFFYWRFLWKPGFYRFKINNGNTKTRCEISSKLTIKVSFTSCSSVFIVNFEQVNAGWPNVCF